MNTLVAAAVLGTARHQDPSARTGTPLDEVLAHLEDGSAEHRLLLAAGAWAVYRRAGYPLGPAPQPPPPAAAETLPPCSPGAARLIEDMLKGAHPELLPETLAFLTAAGRRLPTALLPAALSVGDHARLAMLPVLGERGRWLSQFNPAWHWVRDAVPDPLALPDAAATIWQEGTLAQRLDVLRRQRAHDPTLGRSWLEDVWRAEKAEHRAQLLAALETGLSLADEFFLETALDDRSAGVRKAAAGLLARMSGSALGARMSARAGALLAYTPGGRIMHREGTLRATPPSAVDKAWQRDGVDARPPQGRGERAWWLVQTLAAVPPGEWSARFGVPPSGLIAAARHDEWRLPLLEGWARAALAHRDRQWATALWTWWMASQGDAEPGVGSGDATMIAGVCEALLALVPPSEAGPVLGRLLARRAVPLDQRLSRMLCLLPAPWSADLGTVYLRALRAMTTSLGKGAQDPSLNAWAATLARAALALPAACFPDALAPWPEEDGAGAVARGIAPWHLHYWRRAREQFVETIEVRRRIMLEATL